MDFNAKDVVLVFAVVEEVGLISAEEVVDYLKKELKATIELADAKIILERLRAKDILTIDQNLRYKIAKIPAPWMSMKMAGIKKMKSKDFQKAVEDVDQMFPSKEGLVPPPKGQYKDYIMLEVEFQNIDKILGGVPNTNGGEIMQVHRNHKGIPVIGAGQMYGWFRQNERLVRANANSHGWIGFSEATPKENSKLETITHEEILEPKPAEAPIVLPKQGGCGIAKYEAFKTGTIFKTYITIPTQGDIYTTQNYKDIFTKLFKWCSISPIRGLGANPRFNGGRIQLISINEVDPMTVNG